MAITRGEVYYADLSPVKGSEQGGKRPVVILQNDKGNLHAPTTIVAVVTSRKTKAKLPTHVWLNSEYTGLPKDSMVELEQIRTIDKSRLEGYVGLVDMYDMQKIDRALKISLGVK